MTRIELLHFNDVYNVIPSKEEPVGGASRFVGRIKQILAASTAPDTPVVLFSGDAFNPSLEGTITRGAHMPEVLNECYISAACVGNHDFDFGMPQLEKLIGHTRFPWLLSNVLNSDKSASSDKIQRFLIVEQPNSGLRLGLIGLVEEEWIQTIPSFPPELTYYDFVQVAKDLSRQLRDPNGPYNVDLVIALTHMRVPNDIKLARACHQDVDLILGGHDHFYYVSKSIEIVGDNWTRADNLKDVGFDPEQEQVGFPVRVVKSGTDFRELSWLKLDIATGPDGKRYIQHMTAQREIVTSDITPDSTTERLVQDVASLVASKTATAIGYTTVPLDGRSMSVRSEETNLGNLTADLMVGFYQTASCPPVDIGLCVGGTIRNDSVFPVGEITLGDILSAFPFLDPVVVIRLTGQQLWDALENSVSEYPKQEGRFPQLSGVRLEWNPNAPPGSRVRRVYTVRKGGQYAVGNARRRSLTFPHSANPGDKYQPENMDRLDLAKDYVVATRAYLTGGYDGYTSLKVPDDRFVVDQEAGVLISTMYRKFFLGLKYINAFREYQAKHVHRRDRIQQLVASAAAHWRDMSLQFKRHNHPIDGRSCDCETSSQDGQSFLDSAITDRASYHTSKQGIQDAFEDSSKGHPGCLDPEEDEDERKYDKDSDLTWVKRWASISPVVEGRIVRVDD
ncbi:hypothetical protein [Parasitella parasitica]|uniref:5'-Nucleotidase C-terminal domain-containing protein n=1 Tax=Parasitella parasitica TaxID=35722 RepID=A0A0B7N374_9FUNG|nr:hypothetical protein [Parasitella parasitica]